MQYTMKSGVLYQEKNHSPLARIKSDLMSHTKKIYQGDEEWQLEARVRFPDPGKANTGDVRNKEYILADRAEQAAATALPGYAEGDTPEVAGWPVCRMPRVDHADVTIGGEDYVLTMYNNQNYALKNKKGAEMLRIMHRGIAGGWQLEDERGFEPGILCGLFTFCRYIEQENELMVI